jgi:hypothetical protein
MAAPVARRDDKRSAWSEGETRSFRYASQRLEVREHSRLSVQLLPLLRERPIRTLQIGRSSWRASAAGRIHSERMRTAPKKSPRRECLPPSRRGRRQATRCRFADRPRRSPPAGGHVAPFPRLAAPRRRRRSDQLRDSEVDDLHLSVVRHECWPAVSRWRMPCACVRITAGDGEAISIACRSERPRELSYRLPSCRSWR